MLKLPLLVGFVGLLVQPGATYRSISGPVFGHPVRTFHEDSDGEWRDAKHVDTLPPKALYGSVPKTIDGRSRNIRTTFFLEDGSTCERVDNHVDTYLTFNNARELP